MSVTHGAGLWYMDIGRENFRDAEILKAVERMRRASAVSLLHDRSHVSEVAVVSNPKSEFFLGYRRTEANNISYASYVDQMAAFIARERRSTGMSRRICRRSSTAGTRSSSSWTAST